MKQEQFEQFLESYKQSRGTEFFVSVYVSANNHDSGMHVLLTPEQFVQVMSTYHAFREKVGGQ